MVVDALAAAVVVLVAATAAAAAAAAVFVTLVTLAMTPLASTVRRVGTPSPRTTPIAGKSTIVVPKNTNDGTALSFACVADDSFSIVSWVTRTAVRPTRKTSWSLVCDDGYLQRHIMLETPRSPFQQQKLKFTERHARKVLTVGPANNNGNTKSERPRSLAANKRSYGISSNVIVLELSAVRATS